MLYNFFLKKNNITLISSFHNYWYFSGMLSTLIKKKQLY